MMALGYFAYRKRREQERRFAELSLLLPLKPEASSKRKIWRNAFFQLALVFVIGMLARPQIKQKQEIATDEKGIEAMICLDISNSMLSQDVKPDRLSFAKQVLTRLIDGMGNNKVGLVVFAGNAYTQVPITTDLSSAKQFLNETNPYMLSAQGTAISSAINTALDAFSDNEDIGKSIIILSDGENHEGNAIEAAQKASAKGVRVMVIGIGTAEGAAIPIDGEYIKDEKGQTVVTKFNQVMCQEIADAGKGKFFNGTSATALVKALNSELDKLPKASVSSNPSAGYQEVFQIFGIAALLSLLIEYLIQERKSRFFKRINLFGR